MKFKEVCSEKQKIMSENLIPQNENAETENAVAATTTTAETTAAETATNPVETAKTEGSAAAALTSAVVKIEGQEFPLDVAIAKDDELLKAALSPHYPSIKNANISRETRIGQMIVSIVKRAEHKGIA